MIQFTTMLINFLLFHFCWMGTAFGAANGFPHLGPALVAVSLVIHLLLISHPLRELMYLLLVGLAGYSLDSLLHGMGLYGFPGVEGSLSLPPLWLFGQWVIFGSLFHCSLVWLRDQYLLGSVLGALLGPFSYYSASVLDAIAITASTSLFLVTLGVVWGLVVPTLTWLAHEVDPYREVRMAGYWSLLH